MELSKLNLRMLAIACSALMLASPLTSAQAGPLKDLVKLSIIGNVGAAKMALKGAASLTKKVIVFNAKVAACAAKTIGKKPC